MARNAHVEEWAGFEPCSPRCACECATVSASIPYVQLRCATDGAAMKLIREKGFEPSFCRTLLKTVRDSRSDCAYSPARKKRGKEKGIPGPG